MEAGTTVQLITQEGRLHKVVIIFERSYPVLYLRQRVEYKETDGQLLERAKAVAERLTIERGV